MERVAALDLLRGLAALAVAIPHLIMIRTTTAAPAEFAAVLAVEIFFVLSGFVLGPQILRCLHTGRAGDLGIFLTRRWMRTIPPYLFALALISTIVGSVRFDDVARYAFYVENLFAQRNVHDYFPVAWSLSIEEWFYVTFSAVLMIAAWSARNNRDRFAVLVALCFIAVITVLRLGFGNLDDWGASVRRVVVFRIDSIAYGFLLYMFVRRQARGASRLVDAILGLPVAAALFVVTGSLSAIVMWRIDAAQSHLAETAFPLIAAGFGMSSILIAYSVRNALQHNARIAQICYFLGRVSYSLYLFHLSVAMTIAPLIVGFSLWLQLTVYLAVCIGLSTVFYRVFERPILAMRPRYRRPDEAGAIEITLPAAEAKPVA